ncbi:MAG: threonylcarbamoyl-AMP synthase [Candidatus Altiarchaeota archaeon]|nr:threonylcarbamoyl-AMP synthase [Candidatus Altiarchaeota archaeon]
METRILKKNETAAAAEILKKNRLLAFPTETVYGLGANAFNPHAITSIYKAKGRPTDNPMIIHIADKKDLGKIAKEIPDNARRLTDRFWPGPLTIVLKKRACIPDEATAGLPTVAVRCPKNKIAQKIIRNCGFPIAAPSANKSGRPSPTTAKHVIEDLGGKIDAIIDGGDSKHGLESTVIDMTVKPPIILRPGAVTEEQIRKTIGKVKTHRGGEKMPKSPGMKYRHYAPKAKVVLVDTKQIDTEIAKYKKQKKRVGLLSNAKKGKPDIYISNGKNKRETAKNLYKNLRTFDQKNTDVIIVEKTDEKGLGNAIMNRLRKAAGKK